MARRRGKHQLPGGRHGLARDHVRSNQRDRILASIAELAPELGYVGMAVPRVVKHAGVSQRTFYELFENRLDAFLEAHDRLPSVPVAPTVLESILTPYLGKAVARQIAERHAAALAVEPISTEAVA